jgi:thioredoxin reductase
LATGPIARGGADVLRQERTALRGGAWLQSFGALPWYGWLGLLALVPLAGLVWLARQAARGQSLLKRIEPTPQRADEAGAAKPGTGPIYPHPVIDPLLCIGCHACVEACPHDVLDIVGGVATPVALDQCMEDTSCMVECPTSPKACVVINTRKVIPPRKVPRRDQRLMTNVPGIYLVGDVSGVPLIKNAINEGAQVIEYVVEDLQGTGVDSEVPYDVAIIGIGPAGLSATALARQRGLRYVAIEQNRIVSTIQNYPAGKYVFFKPDTVEAKGGVPLSGVGGKKEDLLAAWMKAVHSQGLEIHEEESCKEIQHSDDHFTITTATSHPPGRATYRARRVILSIGNHGSPMKLGVSGEDLPGRVKFKLSDPDEYRGQKCMVVGAGNSAIEAAVELTGFKREGDHFTFTRDNEVTLVVRSDLKGDLKLGNKMNLYDCLDAGRIRAFFGTTIKEVREQEVVLMDARSIQKGQKGAETARLANDHIFALIGSEKPTKFLEGLGLKIG